ncbi:RNA-binding domain-containing protein [Corynebacterium sp. UBA2622]|uniref:RNA-binding domain-containing protein n=1 Tax=Corynebacterium sp. UBA2622 TaxID=1946393 RepID=UPI0025C70B07|nr:RNA-binding domain-containing protein [Corynebacterium sp. UBA2622]
MGPGEIQQIIARGEGIDVSFARRVSSAYINERAVIERMAALANSRGGTLLVGVGGDGSISGCHPFHGDHTDPVQLAAAIRRYTAPPLDVAVEVAAVEGQPVVALSVAASPTPVATAWGVYRARSLNSSGVAVDEGLPPAELFTRYRDANGVDWATSPAAGASPSDLDPGAFAAYRRLTASHGGNSALAQRGDDSLVRALGFRNDSGEPLSLGAILLFGTEESITRHLPFHQVVVADARTPRSTWRSRAALPVLVERLTGATPGAETVGNALPFVLNALLHRDYTLPGAIYVHVDEDRRTVTSPGPLPRGITAEDVLGGAPSFAPRSLHLTTAIAHTGVTRGAGTGAADAAREMLARGFAAPSYSGTHSQAVTVTIAAVPAGRAASVRGDVLGALRDLGEASSAQVAERAGVSQQQAYRALRHLVEKGEVTRRGSTRTTRYSVS